MQIFIWYYSGGASDSYTCNKFLLTAHFTSKKC